MNDKKIRLFEIVQDVDKCDINKIINWLDGVDCKYLAVKHDKDLPRSPHYHIYAQLTHNRKLEDIARFCGVKEQYIQFVKNWKSALAYAFHLTAKSQEDGKYRYDDSAVISAVGVDLEQIFNTAQAYDDKRDYEESVKSLFYDYGECKISKEELLKKISAEDFAKNGKLFKYMQDYRIMKVRDRDMLVLYITGKSGTGKTTLAKYMARMNNYNTFVSGSGKDVLDGYDKEECIILDDLRGDVFTKAELFKLTDNNTNSSVKSRFRNKDISYCKLMIITSIYAPQFLYNWSNNAFGERDEEETFKQLARRLNNQYLKIEETGEVVQCYYDIDGSGRVESKKLAPFNMEGVFSLMGIEKKLGSTLMDEIFKKVAEDVKKQQDKILNPDTENN